MGEHFYGDVIFSNTPHTFTRSFTNDSVLFLCNRVQNVSISSPPLSPLFGNPSEIENYPRRIDFDRPARKSGKKSLKNLQFNRFCLLLLVGWRCPQAIQRPSAGANTIFKNPRKLQKMKSQTGGGASPPSFKGSLLPGPPTKGEQPTNPTSRGGGEGQREGVHTYLVHTYLTKPRSW